MDPDACLEELLALAAKIDENLEHGMLEDDDIDIISVRIEIFRDSKRAMELFKALDEWLVRGSSIPKRWVWVKPVTYGQIEAYVKKHKTRGEPRRVQADGKSMIPGRMDDYLCICEVCGGEVWGQEECTHCKPQPDPARAEGHPTLCRCSLCNPDGG